MCVSLYTVWRHISIFIFFSVATLFNVDVFFILNIIVEIFFIRRMLFCQTSTGRIKISQWGRWVGIVKRQRWVITAYVRKFEIISYFFIVWNRSERRNSMHQKYFWITETYWWSIVGKWFDLMKRFSTLCPNQNLSIKFEILQLLAYPQGIIISVKRA